MQHLHRLLVNLLWICIQPSEQQRTNNSGVDVQDLNLVLIDVLDDYSQLIDSVQQGVILQICPWVTMLDEDYGCHRGL